MHWKHRCALLGLASIHFTAGVAMSQSPTPEWPYPMNDTPVTLPSGTVVRVRNIVVFAGPSGNSLSLYIQSPTQPTDSARVAREAKELVELHGASTGRGPVTRATVGICRTQACLEMREAPSEMFFFHAEPDGSWRAEAPPAPQARLSNESLQPPGA
jgi:hypothetical protein